MYVTRPRSLYTRDPKALSHPPPEGPNSGYLVIQDEEAETYCCFGLCKKGISNLPLPQNRNLTVDYAQGSAAAMEVYQDKVIFIPALNQPLSSNRYYVIRREGKHQGEASTCSKEEGMGTCFCCNYIKDVKSRPLNPSDEYQQFEIIKKCGGFYAKSIASDGFPPLFLRRKYWSLSSNTPNHYHLGEAPGLNPSLRAKLPPFTFPSSLSSSNRSEPVIIGKWYCPFMFVKEEEVRLKDQMKRSVFYEMTLEKRWDKVFSKENGSNTNELWVSGAKVFSRVEGSELKSQLEPKSMKENEVFVEVVVETEVAATGDGREAVCEEGKVGDEAVMWFRNLDREGGGERRLGLSMAIVERMRWEQERADWVGKNEKQVRFEKVEKFEGSGRWEHFGFYVLVESFVLKRMDGRPVLTYDFRHANHVKCKWE